MNISKMTDHDLLVTMHEQIKNLRKEVGEMKDGTSVKIADHEVRIRRLELWGGMAVGALYLFEAYLKYIAK